MYRILLLLSLVSGLPRAVPPASAQQESSDSRKLESLGDASAARGDYSSAIEYFQQSLTISTAATDKAAMAGLMEKIGRTHLQMRSFDAALQYAAKARDLYEALGDRDRVAATWVNSGMSYRAQGDLTRALESLRKAEAILEVTGNRSEFARVTNSIGLVFQNQANYGMALEYFYKSLKAAQDAGTRSSIATALTNLGGIHRQQNSHQLALDFTEQAARVFEELGNREAVAGTYMNAGIIYKNMGKYELALGSYGKSLQVAQSLKRDELVAGLQGNMGTLHVALGQLPQALEKFEQSLAFYESIGNRYIASGLLTNIGKVHNDQHHYQQALEFAERAATIAKEVGSFELFFEVYDLMGRAQFALGNDTVAREAWEKAIDAIETIRTLAAGGEQDRQRVLESRLSPWSGMVELRIKQNQPFKALMYAEQARARVLLDVLQTGRSDIRTAMDAKEQEQEQELRARLNSINATLSTTARADKPDRLRFDDLQAEVTKARLEYEAFQTGLYAKHPELRAKRGRAPIIESSELASLLPDSRSALLEYAVGDERTYLFILTKASSSNEADVRVLLLPIGKTDLAKEVENFRNQLGTRDLGFRTSSRKLYNLLVKPARAQLSGKSDVVIVPDGELWDLPFQALLDEGDRYLIETSAISYAPSLTVLREMRANRRLPFAESASPALLALGNPALTKSTIERAAVLTGEDTLKPLPEAEQEVKALGALYGRRSKIYVASEASEDRVKAEALQARILHFATHGTLNNASPMYSNLVLAQGGSTEDGLLEAWELMQLDLKADLAVLSACDTARGRFGAGEGVIGLTWGLFVAGVPSTVVSQWRVESASTRDLMVQFHRGLRTGSISKAEALRRASLKLMRSAETSHPFYWAGFVLIGDGR